MKTISIDIETTGTDVLQDQIIQIGLVAFDTNWSPKDFVHLFKATKIYIASEKYAGHPIALHMNADKMLTAYKLSTKKKEFQKNIAYIERNSNKDLKSYLNFLNDFDNRINRYVVSDKDENMKQNLSKILSEFVEEFKNSSGSINVAGKNAAGFDMKFIERYVDQKIFSWKRRILDIGALFVRPADEYIPDLYECMERAGINNVISAGVTHDAMNDAFDTAMCAFISNKFMTADLISRAYEEFYKISDVIDYEIQSCLEQELNYTDLKTAGKL